MSEHPERRKKGEGRIWKRGPVYWIQYYAHGRQVRESSGTDDPVKAAKVLRSRLERTDDELSTMANAKRIRYENLRDALYLDYQTNRRRWLRVGRDGERYICGVNNLDTFFANYRACEITTDALRQFRAVRQSEEVSDGTINRELALLRRMLNLAVEDGKLPAAAVPYFPMTKEADPRKGFLDYPTFQKLRRELPERLRPIVTLAFHTGMRLGEITRLQWQSVNLDESQIRLDAGTTKNGDARVIGLGRELTEMLAIERAKHPRAKHVFIREGERIQSFYKAWRSACKRAGCPGLLFHDLRRAGVRNLVRAGVPEKVAMTITGHKTRSVFDRYNITSERDLKEAAAKVETYLAGQSGDKTGTIATSEQEQQKAAVALKM